jgi:hypothetical protein
MVIDSTVEFWVQGESAWSVEVISIADCGLRIADLKKASVPFTVHGSPFTGGIWDCELRI